MNGPKLGFIIGAVVLALFGAFTVALGIVVGTVVMISNQVILPNSTASANATRGAAPPPAMWASTPTNIMSASST